MQIGQPLRSSYRAKAEISGADRFMAPQGRNRLNVNDPTFLAASRIEHACIWNVQTFIPTKNIARPETGWPNSSSG